MTNETEYDPDVLRVAQKHAEREKLLAEMEHEIEEWKTRAISAEKTIQAFEAHCKNIEADFSNEREQASKLYREETNALRDEIGAMTRQRNHWRDQYIGVQERLDIVAKVVLEAIEKSKEKETNGKEPPPG